MECDGNKCYPASSAVLLVLATSSQECEGLTPKGWADWVTYSVIITHLGLAGLGRNDTSPCGSLWALIQPTSQVGAPSP